MDGVKYYFCCEKCGEKTSVAIDVPVFHNKLFKSTGRTNYYKTIFCGIARFGICEEHCKKELKSRNLILRLFSGITFYIVLAFACLASVFLVLNAILGFIPKNDSIAGIIRWIFAVVVLGGTIYLPIHKKEKIPVMLRETQEIEDVLSKSGFDALSRIDWHQYLMLTNLMSHFARVSLEKYEKKGSKTSVLNIPNDKVLFAFDDNGNQTIGTSLTTEWVIEANTGIYNGSLENVPPNILLEYKNMRL